MRRFVVPEGTLSIGRLALEGDVASHVRDVLRARAGDEVLLSDGTGVEAPAVIAALDRRQVIVAIETLRDLPAPDGLALTLIACVARGDKIDAVVRQACELGVRRIAPVISERSVAEKRSRTDRWRAIAEDAIRVSGRAHRPVIEEVRTFAELLARPRAERSFAFALNGAAPFHRALGTAVPRTMECLVGPEGGLSAAEVEAAGKSGFSIVHLGPHTLRADTAGPAVAAIALYWAASIGEPVLGSKP